MAGYLTVGEALQEAIKDYNAWAIKSAKGYHHERAYRDLKGIFYNKLITRMRETEGFSTHYRHSYGKTIESSDFVCYFSDSCILTNLSIDTYNPYIGEARQKLMKELAWQVYNITFDALPGPIEYRIAAIVNEIKAYKA